MDDLDWRWLRSFAAVAEAGSMREAVVLTGISQPTLSRHIKLLEDTCGVALFARHGRSLRLSRAGEGLFERALVVREGVDAFTREALGLDEEESGPVRVTMSHFFGYHFAPKWLVALREAYPKISIDLSLDNSSANLWMREAEIAVRMFPPSQVGLKMRLCGQTRMGFFASPEYLARHGTPMVIDDVIAADNIGFDRSMVWIEHAEALGFSYTRDEFIFRTDSMEMQMRCAEAGLGIAVVPVHVMGDSSLVRVLPEYTFMGPPAHVTAHPDLHRMPRLARVWRHLIDHVIEYLK